MRLLSELDEVGTVSTLVKAINDPAHEVALEAIKEISKLGPKAKAAKPRLLQLIQDSAGQITKDDFEYAIIEFGANAPNAFSKHLLIQAKGKALLSEKAVEAVNAIGILDNETITTLVSSLRTNRSAIKVLAGLKTKMPPSLIGILRENLRSDIDAIRISTAEALFKIGRPARSAIPELFYAANSKNLLVSSKAIKAIYLIGVPNNRANKEQLLRTLNSIIARDITYSRQEINSILGIKENFSGNYVSGLRAALLEDDKEAKKVAAYMLGQFGPYAKQAVTPLIRILNQDEDLLRVIAIQTLGKIGSEARAAIPSLMKIVENKGEDSRIRQLAVIAIKRILELPINPDEKIELELNFSQLTAPGARDITLISFKSEEIDQQNMLALHDGELNLTSSPASSEETIGGIDLNKVDVDRQGAGVDIQFDPIDVQEIINMGITGFSPIIIDIAPLPSILPLLGLAPQREEDEFELSNLR